MYKKQMKKITALLISFLIFSTLLSFGQPGGGQYTIYIYVYLDDTPIAGATIIATNTANGDNDTTQKDGGTIYDYGNGLYAINLANRISWHYGDMVVIEAYYGEYYGSNYTILTEEGMETGDIVYIFLGLPTNYTLTTSVEPPEGGYIVLDPPGGTYRSGTVVTAVAYAYEGFEFLEWSGDASGTNATVKILMVSDKHIIANFNSPPATPSNISGPATGVPGEIYTYTTSAIDNEGNNIKYGWDWDGDGIVDQWSNFLPSGETCSMSHIWNDAGIYYIRVKAQDEHGAESQWSEAYIVTISEPNQPPATPSPPSGPTNVYVGVRYNYSAYTTDPDGDSIKYGWDWDGDGIVDQWSNFLPSGETCSMSHIWNDVGIYSVKVKAMDEHGLETEWGEALVVVVNETVDETPPSVTFEIGTPYYNDGINEWISSSTPLYINASDEHNYTIYYRIWNGSWGAWQSGLMDTNLILHIQDEGLHYLEYYASDSLGNPSDIYNVSFYVDNTPPATTSTLNPASPDGSNGWYVSDVVITLTSNDTGSGIDTIFYKIGDGEWSEYTGNISLTEDGTHTIYYYAVDNVGNVEGEKSIEVKIDKTSPEISYNITGTPGSNGWYVSDIVIEAIATDATSGISEIKYRIDDEWIDYTEPFSLSDGIYSIEIYAKDAAGNEANVTFEAKVDKTKPTASVFFENDGGVFEIEGEEVVVMGASSFIIINASDERGIQSIYWGIDDLWHHIYVGGAGSKQEMINLMNTSNGIHLFSYRVTDMAGNEVEGESRIFIDTIPSQIAFTLTDVDNGWANFSLFIEDNLMIDKYLLYYAFSPDNETWSEWYLFKEIDVGSRNITTHFTFNNVDQAGYYIFKCISWDVAGNKNEHILSSIFLNISISIEIGLPKYIDNEGRIWIGNNTTVMILSQGEKKVYYRLFIDGEWHPAPGEGEGIGNNFMLCNGAIKPSEYGTGECIIQFYMEGGKIYNKTIYIDNAPPTVEYDIPFYVSAKETISFNPSDMETGIKRARIYYRYSPDNLTWGEWIYLTEDNEFPYIFNISFNKTGFYMICVVAEDMVGNAMDFDKPKICRFFKADLNDDGIINVQDLVMVARHFHDYDAAYDVNGNHVIDEEDIAAILRLWWE